MTTNFHSQFMVTKSVSSQGMSFNMMFYLGILGNTGLFEILCQVN